MITQPDRVAWSAKLRRIQALVRKETLQVLRDPSSIAIGVVLPLILILLFGYGLSLDVKHVPVALVIDDPSGDARALAGAFELSPYFKPRRIESLAAAERLLTAQQVDGIVQLQSDFSRRVAAGDAQVQLIVHGADANRARIIESYVQGAVGAWSAERAAESGVTTAPLLTLKTRLWFNEANDSTYFLVPGLVVLVMTLIGGLLT
jgi:ABC-2 type transport system permease protein